MKSITKATLLTWALLVLFLLSISINIYLLITKGDETDLGSRPRLDIEKNIKDHIEKSLDEKIMTKDEVRELIEQSRKKYPPVVQPNINNGYDKPLDGVDGSDGKDGADGKDSEPIKGDKGDPGDNGKDGYTPMKGTDYFDGKTPMLRCNPIINAWQQRYSIDDAWELVNGEHVSCTTNGTM